MSAALLALLVVLLILVTWALRRRGASGVDLEAPGLPEKIKDKTSAVGLYSYRGERVLYVEPSGFDMYNEVYRLDGTFLGAPSGGLSGHGDGQLPDWSSVARFVRQIRERPRAL